MFLKQYFETMKQLWQPMATVYRCDSQSACQTSAQSLKIISCKNLHYVDTTCITFHNDQLCERLHQCLCVQAEAQHLCEGVKDETEVSDGRYGGKPLFVHVTSLLYESPPNIVVRQTGPQPAHL